MKTKNILLVVMPAMLLLLSTCSYNTVDPGICFQEDVLPIFVTKCGMDGCHNSKDHKEGYDLTTYEGIMKGVKAKHPFQSEVYTSIRGKNPSMPTQEKLSSTEVSIIKVWISSGAQNTSGCQSCDTLDFSYSSRIAPLMSNWCVGCHNTNDPGGGYDFSSYEGVVASISGNKLMGSINHETGFSPMPKNSDKMTSCSVNAIQKWVDAGFPNN